VNVQYSATCRLNNFNLENIEKLNYKQKQIGIINQSLNSLLSKQSTIHNSKSRCCLSIIIKAYLSFSTCPASQSKTLLEALTILITFTLTTCPTTLTHVHPSFFLSSPLYKSHSFLKPLSLHNTKLLTSKISKTY